MEPSNASLVASPASVAYSRAPEAGLAALQQVPPGGTRHAGRLDSAHFASGDSALRLRCRVTQPEIRCVRRARIRK
eukprot:5586944-Prymnesium_polylepis.1